MPGGHRIGARLLDQDMVAVQADLRCAHQSTHDLTSGRLEHEGTDIRIKGPREAIPLDPPPYEEPR
jgi:hypothetical protein